MTMTTTTTATTSFGRLRGAVDDRVVAFRAIPSAQPPVGAAAVRAASALGTCISVCQLHIERRRPPADTWRIPAQIGGLLT
jgi:hypothetical protein